MLDAFIIEELRRREEEERSRLDHRPRLELPVEDDSRGHRDDADDGDESQEPTDRGVVIINMLSR